MHWVVILLAVVAAADGGSTPLSDYVSQYEPLSYSAPSVHAQHLIHKRSAPSGSAPTPDHRVQLDFFSHGRRFRLALERDHSVFHDKFEVLGSGGEEIKGLDQAVFYHGEVKDDPQGHCFGTIRDGVFDGQIVTSHGTYYVERIQRYPHKMREHNGIEQHNNNNNDLKQGGQHEKSKEKVHSVIYHEKNIKNPFHHSRHAGLPNPGCGVSDSVQKWMENVQNSADEDDEPESNRVEQPVQNSDNYNPVEDSSPEYKYTAEANDPTKRVKRSISQENPSRKKSCSLYIQTDPLFWRHIRDQEGDDAKTEEEILSLIAQHVKAVNRIYSDTPFDGKYKHNGYQFEVQRIKILNDSICNKSNVNKNSYSYVENDDEDTKFCVPNVDVSNFLNLHSKSNHEEFCLAYVFTYRDFTGGTLGLAWVASASGASGGICETYKRYTENINGVHQTAKRSLNTGIITFVNYNSRVPPKVSQLTLAHEIGHNFGSPHDYPAECRPGGVRGNFIMFASATSGDRDNNNQFSHCSKSNVSAVLDAIVDGRKPNCFTESNGAFCGNKIVEEGEECDCGFDENECAEQCCYPRKIDGKTDEENKRNRCKRKANTECSPSEGPCCSSSCQFIQRWDKVQCKHEDDCTEAATCDGAQAKCPIPEFKRDNVTECNEGTQVCQAGECKSSICLKYGLDSCFLTSELVDDKRELCELACQGPGANGTCMSTRQLVAKGFIRDLDEGLSLRPGSPCDNFQGYCDVFLKCRKVDAEGPLVRLKNLVFNEETLLTIAQWVTEYWWGVLLMGIGMVIVMAIIIRCCAIHTPSSNPNLPKNLHFSETLRRPVRSLQHKHYRPANSGPGAPPPYPGRSSHQATPATAATTASGGPGHGYGEGRGHYNRSRSHEAAGPQQVPQDRRSAYRSSRIEMQPMR